MGDHTPMAPAARRRVLVIDDEPSLARATARLLAATYDVAVELRGDSAVARVAGGERFDVILCDLQMPEMDGTEVYAALLRVAPEQAARIAFVTGDPGDGRLRAGSHAALGKPFDAASLRAFVRDRTDG